MVNFQKVKYAKFVKILTILLSLLVCLGLYNQSFTQTSASIISEFRELLVSPIILPPQLKADSEATVLSGIARKSWAIDDNIGNFLAFIFHQANIPKSSLSCSVSSSRYIFNSDFWVFVYFLRDLC
jgi:hypothetical protein